MGVLDKVIQRSASRSSLQSIEDYVRLVQQSLWYPGNYQQTLAGEPVEKIAKSFEAFSRQLYANNGPIFALMQVRMLAFSSIRLQWQIISNGRPNRIFGNQDLSILERPWPGGTTQDLLVRMITDVDLAGNFYGVRVGDEIVRLRPDWVGIVLEPRIPDPRFPEMILGYRKVGFLYQEGGFDSGNETIALLPEDVCHFAPYPDPLATYRGMSWLTPVIRDAQNDILMQTHQRKFFENGAPQPLDAKILTSHGWLTMRDMNIGSEVIGSDGKAHRVLAVYPQGTKEVYRVTFADGVSTECTLDHLWQVSNAYDRKLATHRVMTLGEILESGISYPSGNPKWAVPFVEPVEFERNDVLTVDPYLLGLLLGDGSFRNGGITLATHANDTDETISLIENRLPEGVKIVRRDRDGNWSELYFKGEGSPKPNQLTEFIRELGLYGKLGKDKFIPEAYRYASISNRVALLQGLIDSDGSINGYQVRFSTTGETLAKQLVELVLSLGGTASINSTKGGTQWRVNISRLPEGITPSRLARKADSYRTPKRVGRYRHITSVVYVGRKETQCIRVDNSDSLYVTDGYILTHNTPNMVVSLDAAVTFDQFKKFKSEFNLEHRGVENAYKTLYLGGGADVEVVGADFEQMTFNNVQGRGETRLAAAAGVPVTIVGFSEGLSGSSLNAGNFGQARRRLADLTMHPLWSNAAGSLQSLVKPPRDAENVRLWYDARDVPFLREDAKDQAEIMQIKAATVNSLVNAGWVPETALDAVVSDDLSGLKHTGKLSVQLLPDATHSDEDGNEE